jgi:hypothetical protein
VSVISQEDFAKIRPLSGSGSSIPSSQTRPPPPPPINTPCVNAGSLLLQNQTDLDQLDFTFGEDEELDATMNKSNLSRHF